MTPPASSSRAGCCSWDRTTFSSNCTNLGTAHMCWEAKGRMGPRRRASAFHLQCVLQQDTRSLLSPADTSGPDKHRQDLQPFQTQFSSFLFGAFFYCKQVFPAKPCSVLDLLEPIACGILWHLITFVYKGIAKLRNAQNNPKNQSQTNRAEEQTKKASFIHLLCCGPYNSSSLRNSLFPPVFSHLSFFFLVKSSLVHKNFHQICRNKTANC